MLQLDLFWVAILLGVVEGLTEFLPISSTGHLIVTSATVGFEGKRAETFGIFIQLGAILAVVWEYRVRLTGVATGLFRERSARDFVLLLLIAFLPSAVLGLLLHDLISEYLFSPLTVAVALIVGGLLIIVVEKLPMKHPTRSVDSMSWKQGLAIGFAQCVAMWPGFSRSAATILGGLGLGLNRPTATEFSFFLAIPTMFGATFYALLKNHSHLEAGDWPMLTLSFTVSFAVGLIAVRWLLRFVANHTFLPFAWYRIVFGIIILMMLNR